MTFIMKKKKYKFNVTITVEQLSSVPFMNGVLFVKCRLLDGGNFVDHTDRREVEDHYVKWNKTFNFQAKMSANTSTGLLDTCTLRLSIRKETKGGKAYVKLGYADLNLASFPGHGLTDCRCLLEGYESRHHRQDNSMLHLKVDMKIFAGDPCFITPKFTCLTQHSKQGSSDILAASELLQTTKQDDFFDDTETTATAVVPTTTNHIIGLVSDDVPIRSQSQTLNSVHIHHHSNINTPTFEKKSNTLTYQNMNNNNDNNNNYDNNDNNDNDNDNNSNNNYSSTTMTTNNVNGQTSNEHRNSHNYDLTSSTTSNNTTNSSSNFDPFEPNHSRSNSSQTSSSKISATGFNSLPTHSRQGSADSEQNNIRYTNEIKFNSVDRVGNKRNNLYERMKPTVNGGLGESESYRSGPSKKAIDSTRVSADQFVRELLQNNIDETIMTAQPMEMFPNDGGALDIVVEADGSATIISRRQRPSSSSSNNHHQKKSTNGRAKNNGSSGNDNSNNGKESSSTLNSPTHNSMAAKT